MTQLRPTRYTPDHPERARALCREGATNDGLAAAFGVEVRTIYRWRRRYPAFEAAIAIGKGSADDRVEEALYARATGCRLEEVRVFLPAGAPDPVVVRYTRQLPPETAAAALWLRNRRPKQWSGKAEESEDASLVELLRNARARVADDRIPGGRLPEDGDA